MLEQVGRGRSHGGGAGDTMGCVRAPLKLEGGWEERSGSGGDPRMKVVGNSCWMGS